MAVVTVLQPETGRDAGASGYLDDLHAVLSDALSTTSAALAGTAGMGGRVTAFTGAYDQMAAQLMSTGSDLVGAVANLRLMVASTFANYDRAEGAAAHHRPEGPPTVPGAAPPAPSPVAGAPPSSVGDNGGEPWLWAMLTKAHQAAQWPDLDTRKLRTAAAAWASLAASHAQGPTYIECAVRQIRSYHAPELPIVSVVLDTVAKQLTEYAAGCSSLASRLSTSADEADATVAELREKCHHAELDAGAGLGASAVAAAFTFWAAGSGGVLTEGAIDSVLAGSVGASIAETATEFVATLLEVADEYEVALPMIRNAGLVASELRTAKTFMAVLDDLEDAATTDASLLTALGGKFTPYTVEYLMQLEAESNTHVIERHVGQTLDQLAARFNGKKGRGVPFSSTFPDVDTALRCINWTLVRNQDTIQRWLSTSQRAMRLDDQVDRSVGIVMSRDRSVTASNRYRIFLVRDNSVPDGFRVDSAYPVL